MHKGTLQRSIKNLKVVTLTLGVGVVIGWMKGQGWEDFSFCCIIWDLLKLLNHVTMSPIQNFNLKKNILCISLPEACTQCNGASLAVMPACEGSRDPFP